jgi:hypothetical protein
LEELLLKDNENMPFLDDGPLTPAEPQGFSPQEMVRCDVCLRANPPTRAICLYCAEVLPAGKRLADPRAINLKPLEDSVPGYNCILIPDDVDKQEARKSSEAAQVLKLDGAHFERIVSAHLPFPVTRTATREEAELVTGGLGALGFNLIVVSDAELGFTEANVIQIRAADITDAAIVLKQMGGERGIVIPWDELELIVSGRLMTKRVEATEQKGKRGQKEIVEAREFFVDDLVMDLYSRTRTESFRVVSQKFDFSGLSNRSLLAAENFFLLLNFICSKSSETRHDSSYLSLRQLLDVTWPSGQHTASAGWRRERPGKYSVEAVTESSNLNQFTRYSRLSYLLSQRSIFKGGV